MKNYSPAAVWRNFAHFTFLLIAAACAATAQSPQNNEKPKATLFDSYTEGNYRVYQVPASIPQTTRQRIVTASYDNSFDARTKKALPALRATAIERQAFDLINDERQAAGLQPLQWDSEMLYLARIHSENMARQDFFSHTGRDGLTVDGRARQAGVRWQAIGENIAYSQNAAKPAQLAVQCWMDSAGHRRNILSQNWTRAGIGVATAPNGKFYITQVFVK